jgi:acyl carrier protein
MVERGRMAEYSFDEVHYWATSNAFVDQTFDKVGEVYVVKPHIRARVSFRQASLLDPGIVRDFEPADLVFMQNVLCHLDPGPATQAFFNVVQLLKPKSALFVDGMSLDLRESLTRAAGLVPVSYSLREIHEFARTHVGERWWNYYYGMEPYAWWHLDRVRRFSTIFLRDQTSNITQRDVIQSLGSFVSSENGGRDVGLNDPLLDDGLLDSAAIVKLLNFMESRFGVEFSDSDFEPRNFQSLNSLAKLVARHG